MKYKKRYGISKANWLEISKNTRYCGFCGHSMLFQNRTKRRMCKWCGHWAYKSKEDEFKYKILESKKRLENEN